MALQKCAHCGSPKTIAATDHVVCLSCTSHTSFDGELVKGPVSEGSFVVDRRAERDARAQADPGEEPEGLEQVTGGGVTTAADLSTSGGGAPEPVEVAPLGQEVDLASLTKDELYERAQDEEIPGRSDMTKDELIAALSG